MNVDEQPVDKPFETDVDVECGDEEEESFTVENEDEPMIDDNMEIEAASTNGNTNTMPK